MSWSEFSTVVVPGYGRLSYVGSAADTGFAQGEAEETVVRRVNALLMLVLLRLMSAC